MLGGVILNLMPCVFPVLGIKVVGFVNEAGSDRRKVTMHGLMFTLGVLSSFWTLAGVLAALRAGGQELGWGFQLQSAPFVEQWQGKTVKDLFDLIKRSMPADQPDSLTTRAYVDIVAYLMSANHFPSGSQELSREPADLQQIRIEAEGK